VISCDIYETEQWDATPVRCRSIGPREEKLSVRITSGIEQLTEMLVRREAVATRSAAAVSYGSCGIDWGNAGALHLHAPIGVTKNP
jgi:hypothetical protein